jgi:hypothetical protein
MASVRPPGEGSHTRGGHRQERHHQSPRTTGKSPLRSPGFLEFKTSSFCRPRGPYLKWGVAAVRSPETPFESRLLAVTGRDMANAPKARRERPRELGIAKSTLSCAKLSGPLADGLIRWLLLLTLVRGDSSGRPRNPMEAPLPPLKPVCVVWSPSGASVTPRGGELIRCRPGET